ncbi:MAG: hypothetical protein PF483_10065 [Halothiobacillus sp.]|jgi:hypothetical protein|nr:hypothetical protein [Halothiobacillus sp.]
MTEQVWSARVEDDGVLAGLWYGVHGLATVAVVLGMVISGLSLWLTVPAGALAWLGLFVSARYRPAAWFVSGHLVLANDVARWQANDEGWVDGRIVLAWRGTSLVGVTLIAPAGRMSLWLTRRRVGDVAWWQLQRWLVLQA